MGGYDTFTEEQKKNLDEGLRVIMSMPEEQFQAVEGAIPMTGELFGGCMDTCLKIGAYETAFRLMNQYRTQAAEWADAQEKNLRDIEIPEGCGLEINSVWKSLKNARQEEKNRLNRQNRQIEL